MKSITTNLSDKNAQKLITKLKGCELTNLLVGEGIMPKCKHCGKRLPYIYVSQNSIDSLYENGEFILSKSTLERYFPELKAHQIFCFRNQVCYVCRNIDKRPDFPKGTLTEIQQSKKDNVAKTLANAENPLFIQHVASRERSKHCGKFPKKFTAKQWSHITQLNTSSKTWSEFSSKLITRSEFLEKLNNL